MREGRTKRMTTSIERVFKKLPDGLCREIHLHFLVFLDDEGKIVSSKLDKSIQGKLYKKAVGNERSMYGEVEYKFPDEDEPVRLIALGRDYDDNRYGL